MLVQNNDYLIFFLPLLNFHNTYSSPINTQRFYYLGEVNLDLNGAIRYLNKKHLVFQGDGCACQPDADQPIGSAQGPAAHPQEI